MAETEESVTAPVTDVTEVTETGTNPENTSPLSTPAGVSRSSS